MAVKGNKCCTLNVFALCFMGLSSLALATDSADLSLRGLKGLYISVERLDPEIRKDGLTEDEIKRDTTLILKKAGIKVLSKEEWFDHLGNPYLYLNTHVLRLGGGKEYIYSIHVALRQNVYLAREPIEVQGAATWWTGTTTGITPNLEKVRASIRAQVIKFAETYISVNR